MDLPSLKRLKNSVIGNPSAKAAVAQDAALLQALIECLNDPPNLDADGVELDHSARVGMRVEAAHVLSSLSHGSLIALATLLRFRAHQGFLFALSHLSATDPSVLRAALARGLRTLVSSIADIVGPSLGGLSNETCDFIGDASEALRYILEPSILDIFLPLLGDPTPQVRTAIAHMLAVSLRGSAQRTAVASWLPPAERAKETKGKRGWEKPEMLNSKSPARQGGWVARALAGWLTSSDVRVQEAGLLALGALARENGSVATPLARPGPDGEDSTLNVVVGLCKARSVDVRLAASTCAGHITRANPPAPTSFAPPFPELSLAALHTLNRIIASPAETLGTRTKACFAVFHIVSDESSLCQTAVEHGVMATLTGLVAEITPLEPAVADEWSAEEPDGMLALREACLTTLAALALFDNAIRRRLVDAPRLVPVLHASLAHARAPGVRFAACQVVRALSRAVSVVRTSLLDTGLGRAVIGVFMRADEERRVTWSALAAICNLVVDFSPLREEVLKEPAIARLVYLLNKGDKAVRLNVLWAIKNMLWKAPTEVKRTVMERVGWLTIAELMRDPDPGIQEQAFHVLRHIADQEEDVEMTFQVIGADVLLDNITVAMDSDSTDVQCQAAGLLANLANGADVYQSRILEHPRIILALRKCLIDANVDVRRPAVACVLQLVRGALALSGTRALRDAGLESALRHLCEGGPALGAPLSPGAAAHARAGATQMGMETDREVREKAREALHLLEHSFSGLEAL